MISLFLVLNQIFREICKTLVGKKVFSSLTKFFTTKEQIQAGVFTKSKQLTLSYFIVIFVPGPRASEQCNVSWF
jgi:hypothetical protein